MHQERYLLLFKEVAMTDLDQRQSTHQSSLDHVIRENATDTLHMRLGATAICHDIHELD